MAAHQRHIAQKRISINSIGASEKHQPHIAAQRGGDIIK